MYDEESEVWHPIDASEKNEALNHLLAAGQPLRIDEDGLEILASVGGRDGENLSVSVVDGKDLPFPIGKPVTVRFEAGAHVYMFRSVVSGQGVSAPLLVPEEIYRLQRRRHMRLAVPAGFPSRFEVAARPGAGSFSCSILDISAFGVGFLAPVGTAFQPGEMIDGSLQLGLRPAVRVGGRVRFLRTGESGLQVGIEFDHRLHGSQGAVQDALMFYRADVFRFKNQK